MKKLRPPPPQKKKQKTKNKKKQKHTHTHTHMLHHEASLKIYERNFYSHVLANPVTYTMPKGTIKRATKTCNLFFNIAAIRVEKRGYLSFNKPGCCRLRKVVAESTRRVTLRFATNSVLVLKQVM